MRIDVRKLLRGECDATDLRFELAPDGIDDVEFPSGAEVSGDVTNHAGYIRLKLHIRLPYVTECARCLRKVEGVFETDLCRTVVARDAVPEDDIDEYIAEENGYIDADDDIKETIALEFPVKIVCSEDCEGLCPVCGRPKREGCGCRDDFTDPRFDELKKLLDDE